MKITIKVSHGALDSFFLILLMQSRFFQLERIESSLLTRLNLLEGQRVVLCSLG